ncbi:MAG TPA: glycosyltransferase family 87 protein [Solirubrobacteraceae bacterium]
MSLIDPHFRLANMARMLRGRQQADEAAGVPASGVNLSSGQGDAAVLLPRFGFAGSPFRSLRVAEALRSPTFGRLALGVLFVGTVLVVLYASSVPSTLVQGSYQLFPSWMAGPLHGLLNPLTERGGKPIIAWQAVDYAYTGAIVVMFIAYAIALIAARTLSMRAIAITIAAAYALIALSPPLGLSDMFNYLGYARLGGLHGLNPYTHVIADEFFDPVYKFATWRSYRSPYGQVFTLLTYPLGRLSLPAAYWVLKVEIVALMGVFVALVGRCARQLGYDPRYAVIFVGLNPIVLINDLGGFHNDAVMLVPMMAAVSLLLARRYRWAGVALAVAIGVKPTVVLLLPFMMLAAHRERRSLQVLLGTVLGGIVLGAVSFAFFGLATPNVADQSIIVTPLSVVNLIGLLLHAGGATPGIKDAAKVVLVLTVVGLVVMGLRRRRPDWISGAGWATLALLVCTAWLMPWYIIWVLPLVALSTSRALRRAMIALMAFAVLTFLPPTAMQLGRHHIDLMQSHADQVANHRLWLFQHSDPTDARVTTSSSPTG